MGKAGIAISALLDGARLALSVYSLYIKMMLDSSPGYKAQCDISEYLTCSKPFNSTYSKGLGLVGPLLGEDHVLNQSNGIYGIVIFLMHLLLVCFVHNSFGRLLRLVNSLAVAAGSAWLAYVLFYQLGYLCPVCLVVYGLNALALLADACQLRARAPKSSRPGSGRGDKKKRN